MIAIKLDRDFNQGFSRVYRLLDWGIAVGRKGGHISDVKKIDGQ